MILATFLAIAGSAAASAPVSETNYVTMTFPFENETDVNALIVSSTYVIAFGDNQALKYTFKTEAFTTLNYDTAKAGNRTVRDAIMTTDGKILIAGDKQLNRISADNGKTWETIIKRQNIFADFKLIINQGEYWFFLPNSGQASYVKANNLNPGNIIFLPQSQEQLKEGVTITNGFSYNGIPIYVASNDGTFECPSSINSIEWFPSWISYIIKPSDLIKPEDFVISSLMKDGYVYYITENIFNFDFSLNIVKHNEKPTSSSINNIAYNDNFFPRGYVFPDGKAIFIGNDKDGKAITIDLDLNREDLNCDLTSFTCLAGNSNTLILGGKNSQVAMPSKLTKVEENFDEDIFLTQSNSQLKINGTENASWEIFSPLGTLILSGEGTVINTNIPSGMYIIKITVEKNTITKKFVI